MLEPILFGRVIDALSQAEQFGSYVSLWLAIGLTNAVLSICLSVTAVATPIGCA